MLERLIENWLDNTSERGFQVPFCHWLQSEGHRVVHLTRHCGMELGKDVLSVAPDGVTCAFQLKSGTSPRLSLAQWRADAEPQMTELVMGKPVHPSLPKGPHRAYFVTNRMLEEEASRAIDDINRGWADAGHPEYRIRVKSRGDLLAGFRDLGDEFWPFQPTEIRDFLRLYLSDGTGQLPRADLAQFLEVALESLIESRPSEAAQRRAFAALAVYVVLCVHSFTEAENHSAEAEAWGIYLAILLGAAQRWNLSKESLDTECKLALSAIQNALGRLCEELRDRDHFFEGDLYVDPVVRPVRMTLLVALASVYGLMARELGEEGELEDFTREFCARHITNMELWGEAAVPLFLVAGWYLRQFDPSPRADSLLGTVLETVAEANRPSSKGPLPFPYYDAEQVLLHRFGVPGEEIDESFAGMSYTIQALLHLYVRCNWKQRMRLLWPSVSRVTQLQYQTPAQWRLFRWRNRPGILQSSVPQRKQDWTELSEAAADTSSELIPRTATWSPAFLAFFLCIYPHRLTAPVARWLDAQF